MPRPAVSPGRLLERSGDAAPRGMTAHDRTRLMAGSAASIDALASIEAPKFAEQTLGPRPLLQTPPLRGAPLPRGSISRCARNPKICRANFGPRYVLPIPTAIAAPPYQGGSPHRGDAALVVRNVCLVCDVSAGTAAASALPSRRFLLPLPFAREGWVRVRRRRKRMRSTAPDAVRSHQVVRFLPFLTDSDRFDVRSCGSRHTEINCCIAACSLGSGSGLRRRSN